MINLLAKSSTYQNINMGDIKFYLIVAGLLIILCIILYFFSKTKGFKARKRKNLIAQQDEYITPNIIKVDKVDIDNELYSEQSISKDVESVNEDSQNN